MRLHWFNPENDLALAVGESNYTAPRGPLKLQKAGALLPLWYGAPGDQVLCYGVNQEWFTRVSEEFDIQVTIFNHIASEEMQPSPWGWSTYTRRIYADEGFALYTLPTDSQLERIRQLSHRRTASLIAEQLAEEVEGISIAPAAYEAHTEADAMGWLKEHQNAMVKQPWSSSGRGVLDTRAISSTGAMRFISDTIRRQGSIMMEQIYDRAIDFARLYECHDGKCTELGTSMFSVDSRGGYAGNLLAPEWRRLEEVGHYFPIDLLQYISDKLRGIIEIQIAPHYSGILGVDMLVDKDGTLDAVVEINLRKTMGYVANRITELYLHPESRDGIFQVVRSCDFDGSESYISSDHRIVEGTLLLTPNNQDFTFAIKI